MMEACIGVNSKYRVHIGMGVLSGGGGGQRPENRGVGRDTGWGWRWECEKFGSHIFFSRFL
jgi:hypothetical protein